MSDINQNTIQELIAKTSPAVQEILAGDEVNKSAATLGKLYNLPIPKYLPLKNTITLILLGAIDPSHAVDVLETSLGISHEQATKLAEDLDKSIFQKAHIKILGEAVGEIKTITLGNDPHPEELRKEILDTTKRESAIDVSPVTPNTPRPAKVITLGSRSQLMEQLDVLGNIPDDEEIQARLAHIQEQLRSMEPKEETPSVTPSAEQNLTHGGEVPVEPAPQAATYSKAPTKYNIDPYREIA